MKKILKVILFIFFVFLVAFGIYNARSSENETISSIINSLKKTSTSYSAGSSGDNSTLESYVEEEEITVENKIIDETEEYSDEELKELEEEVLAFIEEYYSKVFDFSGEDKTDTLLSYYREDKTGSTNVAQNSYETFTEIGYSGNYESYTVFQFIVKDIEEDFTDICVMGAVNFSGSSDAFEEGEYSVYNQIVVDYIDGKWQIYSEKLTKVTLQGDMYAVETDYEANHMIKVYGNKVYTFDFT